MPNEKTQHHSALRSKNFRIFLYGNTISVLGIWIQRLALGWQAWQLSESSLMVGLVAAMQFLPLLLLTPFFGVFVDRIRPRYGMIVMHCVLMLIATVLGMLTLTDRMTIEILLLLSLLHGIANSAYSPIRLALIPDLVEQSQFPSAVAISSVIFNTSRFVGAGTRRHNCFTVGAWFCVYSQRRYVHSGDSVTADYQNDQATATAGEKTRSTWRNLPRACVTRGIIRPFAR